MNPFRKAYCRIYQIGFRIALPFLPYRHPQIVGSVRDLPAILKKKGCRRILLVTDAGVRGLGLTKELEEVLAGSDIFCAVYDKTDPNPTTDNIAEAVKMYRREHCEGLIGFGGGSSMDCAKAVGACIVRPNLPLSKMEGILTIRRRLPLLIAVPTTAGTGSETTLAAVVVDAQTRHKYAIDDFVLIPHYAVLDPEVTVSLPPQLTAGTGMDALTHAVEAYIGRSTTAGTRKDAKRAVSLIFAHLDEAYQNGQNRAARESMLHASYCAGCAFTKSYVGYVHAVAHSLGGAYNVPHGQTNAILLPMVLRRYGHVIDKKLAELAVAAKVADASAPQADAAEAFIRAIEEMKERFGLGNTIPQLRREDIPRLARYADHEANPLYPVPVLWDAKELEALYEMVLPEGEEAQSGKAEGRRGQSNPLDL